MMHVPKTSQTSELPMEAKAEAKAEAEAEADNVAEGDQAVHEPVHARVRFPQPNPLPLPAVSAAAVEAAVQRIVAADACKRADWAAEAAALERALATDDDYARHTRVHQVWGLVKPNEVEQRVKTRVWSVHAVLMGVGSG